MNTNITPLTFTVPLAIAAHSQAEQFRRHHSQSKKAKQVYLNTLAVYAVNYYLECQGFKTSLSNSGSWDTLMQTLMDVADVEIPDYGMLECRLVLPGEEAVYVPEEVWDERIGYVAVQFDESLREATLLGFVEKVSGTEIPLTKLQSLEDLPEYLRKFGQPKQKKKLVQLSPWLHNVFETGWETLETLLEPSGKLALNFRNTALRSSQVQGIQLEHSEEVITRGRKLQLQGTEEQVNLCVGLIPITSETMDIIVKLYPIAEEELLPSALQLMVLDEEQKTVMQAETGSSESLEFHFSGDKGEGFSIKVALGDFSIIEEFLI